MNRLPNIADIQLTFNTNDDFFYVSDKNGNPINEFITISNIILHDVVIEKNGDIRGRYIKPKSLIHYDENVDKTEFPTFISWSLFDGANMYFKEQEFALKDTKVIAVDGYISPFFENKRTTYKNAFFQIRRGYNQTFNYVSLTEYEIGGYYEK